MSLNIALKESPFVLKCELPSNAVHINISPSARLTPEPSPAVRAAAIQLAMATIIPVLGDQGV